MTKVVASAITKAPFGPIESFSFGNGLPRVSPLDTDYRPTRLASPNVQDLNYSYDLTDRVWTGQLFVDISVAIIDGNDRGVYEQQSAVHG